MRPPHPPGCSSPYCNGWIAVDRLDRSEGIDQRRSPLGLNVDDAALELAGEVDIGLTGAIAAPEPFTNDDIAHAVAIDVTASGESGTRIVGVFSAPGEQRNNHAGCPPRFRRSSSRR